MNLLLAGQSGWGKSFKAQHTMEENIPRYDHLVVLDYKDEYRGLVKADLASWFIAGPRELSWSQSQWLEFLRQNPRVVIARHKLGTEEWQELAASIVGAARQLRDVLVAIDEAHSVAPQKGSVPEPLTMLATTGRGEGASSMWITQRPATLEEDVLGLCQAKLLGGFDSDSDLDKIGKTVEYPQAAHDPRELRVGLPEDLLPPDRDEPESVQVHENDREEVIGSEWIYSDNTGERYRRDTRGLANEMQSTHYGKQGKKIKI